MHKAVETKLVVTILTLLSTAFVGLRAVSRFGILKRASTDDYLILLALTLSWCYTSLQYAQIHFGVGQNLDRVSSDDVINLLKCFYPSVPIYNIALVIVKLSGLFQSLRFFHTSRYRAAAWSLITINSMYGIGVSIAALCSCRPISAFWDRRTAHAKCINFFIFWYFNASYNIASDIAVVALPLFALRRLDLPRQQKFAVMAIFAVGGLACITSIIRLYKMSVLLRATDFSYDGADIAIWSAAELNIAIVCACMPSLKPVCRKLIPRRILPSWCSSNIAQSSDSMGMGHVKRLGNLRIDTFNGDKGDVTRRGA